MNAIDWGLVRSSLGPLLDGLLRGTLPLAAVSFELGLALALLLALMRLSRQVADQVLFLDGGAVVEQGPPGEVLVEPREPRTRQFLHRLLDPL